MSRLVWCRNQSHLLHSLKFRFIIALGLSLLVTPTVLATYQPPPQSSAPQPGTTTTGGTRGNCAGKAETGLTTLAPFSYVGQTSSDHPTFAWFVPETQSYLLKFRLYKYGANNQRELIDSTEMQSQQGMMQRSLPQNKPGLDIGQRYLWQVVLLCNPNAPSTAIVAETEIKRVDLPPVLKSQLAKSKQARERVNLYSESGQWYDALDEALQAPQDRELKISLLKDLRNAEIKMATQISPVSPNILEFTKRLQKIVEFEQKR